MNCAANSPDYSRGLMKPLRVVGLVITARNEGDINISWLSLAVAWQWTKGGSLEKFEMPGKFKSVEMKIQQVSDYAACDCSINFCEFEMIQKKVMRNFA